MLVVLFCINPTASLLSDFAANITLNPCKMATAQAANFVEKHMSHEQKPITDNVSNYSSYGESSQTMKALTWQGKKSVKVGQ